MYKLYVRMPKALTSMVLAVVAMILFAALSSHLVHAASTSYTPGPSPVAIASDFRVGHIYTVNADYVDNATGTVHPSVSVIDPSSHSVIRTIALPNNSEPERIVADPATSQVYTTLNQYANSATSKGAVEVIDGVGQTAEKIIPVDNYPTDIVVDGPNGLVYVVCERAIDVISIATNTVIAAIPLVGAESLAVNTGAGQVYASVPGNNTLSVINESTQTVVASIPVSLAPYDLAYDPSSGLLYVSATNGDSTQNAVLVVNVSTHAAIATIPVGEVAGDFPGALKLDLKTHALYVIIPNWDHLLTIDTETNTITNSRVIDNAPPALGRQGYGGYEGLIVYDTEYVSEIDIPVGNTSVFVLPL